MSMVVEYFGDKILKESLDEVKREIKRTPYGLKERKGYMLKEWAAIKGVTLTDRDFRDVEL